MSKQQIQKQANETVSKYKLLSSYGGPGSLIHTSYGSVIISCIEEWGFIKNLYEIIREKRIKQGKSERELFELISEEAILERNGNLKLSDDERLLKKLQKVLSLENLKFLSIIPDIDIIEYNNKIEAGKTKFSIPSSYMPKIFYSSDKKYKRYNTWYKLYYRENKDYDQYLERFFPPKNKGQVLNQDNLVLICENGHINDFPWAKYLNYKTKNPGKTDPIDFSKWSPCCGTNEKPLSEIRITSSSANESGFEGKRLKCDRCNKNTSLKGVMNIKVKCNGDNPWELNHGDSDFYSGNKESRQKTIYTGECGNTKHMKPALSTGNNLYYSNILSSIYLPNNLFMSKQSLEKISLEAEKDDAVLKNDFMKAMEIQNRINEINLETINEENNEENIDSKEIRKQEFIALSCSEEASINSDPQNLKVKSVTSNLDADLNKFFSRILRIDNLKITSAQTSFTRVSPIEEGTEGVEPHKIFRSKPNEVEVYPVIENYGEGIFFCFNQDLLNWYFESENGKLMSKRILEHIRKEEKKENYYARSAITRLKENGALMVLLHSFSHLIMRELEFMCGYPTASLSERLYYDTENHNGGVLIYTAEGTEGSMGGLIAQSRKENLNRLIKNALYRAQICNSDPLCWESEGQGLFNMNLASCFSCSLISETSCEHQNMFLDRLILVDENNGFFREVLNL